MLISFATAQVQQKNSGMIPLVISDTITKKDSVNSDSTVINDLRLGFKDLFTTDAINNDINVEQLNPEAINFVQGYLEKFGKKMEDMKGWGKPYFDMMDDILVQHGLPKELKYLSVIESNLKFNARSRAGAVGPWQFMPATARNFGLKVNRYHDDRTDYIKSTNAASQYLTNLFEMYGDWLLVIAAYNGGPGKVNSAIKKSGSTDFWTLQKFLPAESRNHVKKFIATHYIMECQGGITTLTKDETKNLLLNNSKDNEESGNTKIQTINGRYNSLVVAKNINMDIVLFSKMNPDFDKLIANNGSYELRLPNDKMDIFLAQKNDILNESVQMLLKQTNDANR